MTSFPCAGTAARKRLRASRFTLPPMKQPMRRAEFSPSTGRKALDPPQRLYEAFLTSDRADTAYNSAYIFHKAPMEGVCEYGCFERKRSAGRGKAEREAARPDAARP